MSFVSKEAKRVHVNKISRQHIPVTFSSFEATPPLFFIPTVKTVSGKRIIKKEKS